MFGGAHKPGRGGGGGRGGGVKRNVYALQNPSRPTAGVGGGGGRLSLGGSGLRGRNPSVAASTPAQSAAVDESFSLVAGGPLSFAATLRLPPGLVEEIKRVEAQGGAAKIKFDSNTKEGNVIDVGGKEFRFTWSHEVGDLCDIYEEPLSGEDSNGMLIESGCVYRKLNVQRTLDESTKNHLKMLSEESERKMKARKTKVLDPSNPSMKSQIKAIAAVDASPWKNFHKPKKEPPFKKRKFEPTQVGGPPKVAQKSGFPSATSARGRHSTSPLPSPPVQSVSLVSPSVAGNPSKTQENTGAATPIHATTEDNVIKPDKDAPGKAFPGVPETAGNQANESAGPADLQSMLTSLLKDNPNGMSLKALEKAVGDVFPSSSRKIEPILKKIATCKAPGRYFLNSEAELENSKRFPQSGSSPEGNRLHASDSKEMYDDAASPNLMASVEKFPHQHAGEQGALDLIFVEDANVSEKIDITQNSPDPFGEKNSEGHAGGTSDSGSSSDSESDSGSDSRSQSRSRSSDQKSQSRSSSPAESGSGSSSESESDPSSNSKEGSDMDVDIMSDDENEAKHTMQASDPGFPTFPSQDDGHVENGIVERLDDQHSEDIDIDGDQDIDVGTASDLVPNTVAKSIEEFRSTLPNQVEHEERWTGTMLDEQTDNVTGAFKQENQDRSQKAKGKSRKALNMRKFQEISDHAERIKPGGYAEFPRSGFQESLLSGSPRRPSLDKLNEDQYKDGNLETENRYKDGNIDLVSQRDNGYQISGKSVVELQQSGRRPTSWPHDPDSLDQSGKYVDSWSHGTKYHERRENIHEGFVKQKNKTFPCIQDEQGNSYKKTNKKVKESGSGNKHATQLSSLQRKRPDHAKKCHPDPSTGFSQQDGDRATSERFPFVTGKDNMLRRELSELELGELREPLPIELDGNNNHCQGQGSFKQFDAEDGTSDTVNINSNKGKPAGKPTLDLKQASPVKGVRKGSSKRSPAFAEDRPSNRSVQSHPETEILSNEADARPDEAFENNVIGLEGYGETHKKEHARRQNRHYDSKQERASISGKGTKSQKSIPSVKSASRVGDACLNGRHNDNHKSDSSSDENSSFSKYEKEEPELKGPIKDLIQYKEYVQEYRDKYVTYCSLNKSLENYRNKFHKMGKDLESAKNKDRAKYNRVLRQLRESYHRCGEKHKRQKKTFVVLHKELEHLKQRMKDFAAAHSKD